MCSAKPSILYMDFITTLTFRQEVKRQSRFDIFNFRLCGHNTRTPALLSALTSIQLALAENIYIPQKQGVPGFGSVAAIFDG